MVSIPNKDESCCLKEVLWTVLHKGLGGHTVITLRPLIFCIDTGGNLTTTSRLLIGTEN